MTYRDRIIDFIRVPARSLFPSDFNWRKHGEQQTDAVAASLEELGIVDPLKTYRTPDGTLRLFDGHLRRNLFHRIGPDTMIPVVVTDLDEAEAKKANLIFDPLAGMAEADTAALDALLREVETGSEELQKMLAELAAEHGVIPPDTHPGVKDGLCDPDEVPAPPDEATTRLGDLWLLGNHRLLCGDSSKPEDVDQLLDGAVIHLVNTDPPYNVKVEPRSNNAIAAGLSSFEGTKHHQGLDLARHPEKSKPTQRKLRPKDRPLTNDFVSEEAFEQLLDAWLDRKSVV